MFERYTERARRALFFARYEASEVGGNEIGTEHLLLGLLGQAKGCTSDFFERAGLRHDALARTCSSGCPAGRVIPQAWRFHSARKQKAFCMPPQPKRISSGQVGVRPRKLAIR